jgi:hypothetical protein
MADKHNNDEPLFEDGDEIVFLALLILASFFFFFFG